MRFEDTVSRGAVIGVVERTWKGLIGSAVIGDHKAADILAELQKQIEELEPVQKWRDLKPDPPVDTLILIRIEYKAVGSRPAQRAVGVGTFHERKDAEGYYARLNGSEINRQTITGWQFMPKP